MVTSVKIKTPEVKEEVVNSPPAQADYSPAPTGTATRLIIRFFPWLARVLADVESAIKAGSKAWRL